jgi:hypothetical protein
MNTPSKPYGSPTRGVTLSDVSRAADTLLRAGQRPTVSRIRAAIGSGSPNTVGPLLDTWWKALAGRLDDGPAAFHRLPESVAHVAEALWMRALEEGRRRALAEQRLANTALTQGKESMELRSHVLTLREGEMEARIQDRDRTLSELREQCALLTRALKQEQTSRSVTARRLSIVEAELAEARRARAPVRAPGAKGRNAALKYVRRAKAPAAKRTRPKTPKRRGHQSRESNPTHARRL